MSDELFFDGTRFIPASEAAGISNLTRDYITRLARESKVVGRQVGRQWYVSEESFKAFLVAQEYANSQRRGALTRERQQEYDRIQAVQAPEKKISASSRTETPSSPQPAAFTSNADLHRKLAAAAMRSGAQVISKATTIAGNASAQMPLYAVTPGVELLHKVAAAVLALALVVGLYSAEGSLISTSPELAPGTHLSPQVELSATAGFIGDTFAKIASVLQTGTDAFLAPLFGVHLAQSNTPTEVVSLNITQQKPSAPVVASSKSSQTIINNNPVIERVVQSEHVIASGGITESELNQRLQELDNELSEKIYTATAANSTVIAQNYNVTAQTNAIDQLTNTAIYNPSISGGSINGTSVNASSLSVSDTATSTFAGGIDIAGGCFAVNGTCISGGGGGAGNPGGSDTQVQFNDNGVFNGSSSFTFASSTQTLSVLNASTSNATSTNFAAINLAVSGIASTSNLVVSNGFTLGSLTGFLKATAGVVSASLVNLASDVTGVLPIANGGTGTTTAPSYGQLLVGNSSGGYSLVSTSSLGIVSGGGSSNVSTTSQNTWSALQLFAGNASSSNFSNFGVAYFGGTATSSFDSSGQLTLAGISNSLLSTNASGQVVATTSIGTNLLTGTLGTINSVSLTAGGSITITAASSTLLTNSNTFSGNNLFTASTTFSNLININQSSTSLATLGTTWLSGIANALLSTDQNGKITATTSIGTNLLTGTLGVGNGGTGANSFSYGLLLSPGGTGAFTNIATSSLGLPTFTDLAAAYPFPLTGNATSTLTQFNGGLTAFASSTIGNGTQGGGLTVNGGATTTGNAYFASKVTIGTTTPYGALQVVGPDISNGTGTLSDDGSGNITGSGTSFVTQLRVGDLVTDPNNNDVAQVTEIIDDTHLTVSPNFGGDTNFSFTYEQPVISASSANNLHLLQFFGARGSFSVGNNSATGLEAFAGGGGNNAFGNFSSAFGSANTASGVYSFAGGNSSVATNTASVAFGESNNSGGEDSFVSGNGSSAFGDFSNAFGRNTTVDGTGSFGIGLDGSSYTVSNNNVFAILGGDVGLSANTHINFDAINSGFGDSGYGFRDNSGIIEYKDSSGSWTSFDSLASPIIVSNNNIFSQTLGALSSITSGTGNVALGSSALQNDTSGGNNVAIGVQALQSNIDSVRNIGIGSLALFSNTSASDNIALGLNSLYSYNGDIFSGNNIAIGQSAGQDLVAGSNNIAIGENTYDFFDNSGSNQLNIGNALYGDLANGDIGVASGKHINFGVDSSGFGDSGYGLRDNSGTIEFKNNGGSWTTLGSPITVDGNSNLYSTLNTPSSLTSGNYNVALGYQALPAITSGQYNVAFGIDALQVNQDGSNNVGLGVQSLQSNVSGSNNVGFGPNALQLSTGSNNVALGSGAGSNLTSGDNNIAIGQGTNFRSSSASNQLDIGNTIYGDLSLQSISTGDNSNAATGQWSFIGGGASNSATNTASVVLGGNGNNAGGTNSVVSGESNSAYAGDSFVAGGSGNITNGTNSFIGGGSGNTTNADNSIAFGTGLTINGTNSIGFGLDGNLHEIDQAHALAVLGGNVGIGTTSPSSLLHLVNPDLQSGTGTLTDDGNGNITGTGTAFTSQLHVGDTIQDVSNYGFAVVTSITDDTDMTVSGYSGALRGDTNFSFEYQQPIITAFSSDGINSSALQLNARGGFATGKDNNLSSGQYSFTAGDTNVATGFDAFAAGSGNNAIGDSSFALGQNVTANGYGSFGIGLDGNPYTIGNDSTFAILGGNVGIGTTSPTNRFEVAGNTFLGGNLTATGTLNVTGKATLGNASTSIFSVSGTSYLASAHATGLALSSVLTCTGSQALQTDGSGNISCGTIASGGASSGGGWTTNNIGLVTLSTTTDLVTIGASSSPYAKLNIISGNAATTTLSLVAASGQSANLLDIYDSSGALNSVFTADGSLGIGTTSPGSILSINGVGNFVNGATSTLYHGLNITSGCFSINGTCLGSSSASTTLLTDNNSWAGLQSFAKASTTLTTLGTTWFSGISNSLLSTNQNGQVVATTSIGVDYLTGTLGVGNGGTGLASTPTYGQLLVGNGTGYTLTATSSLGLPQFSDLTSQIGAAYPFPLTGNATSTLTQFNGGLTAYASSTIGAGGQATGLTISGGATTTGNAYFGGSLSLLNSQQIYLNGLTDTNWRIGRNIGTITKSLVTGNSTNFLTSNTGFEGFVFAVNGGNSILELENNLTAFFRGNVGIGTTTPNAKLSIAGSNGGTTALFTVSSSTSAFATTTVFNIDQNGNTTIGNNGSTLSINGATTTAANGINLTTGCFAVGNNCLTLGSFSGTLSVGNGGTGQTSLSSSQLLYGAGSGAVQSVATTTQTFSGPFSLSASQGYLVGGNSATITWTGLATTSALTAGQLLYSNGGAGVTGVSTSTLTASSPLTGSFIQIGSGGSLGCQTASGSQAGCLSSADWTTFNSKLSADPFWTYANSAIATSSPVLITASTTIGNGTVGGGLTINGGATTTGAALDSSTLRVGSSAALSGTGFFAAQGTVTDTSGSINAFNIQPVWSASADNTGQQRGIGVNNVISGAHNDALIYAANFTNDFRLNGTNVSNAIVGFSGVGLQLSSNSNNFGTVNTAAGANVQGAISFGNSFTGTITNAIGLLVNDSSIQSDKILNDIGIKIATPATASTTAVGLLIGNTPTSGNYGIYDNSTYNDYLSGNLGVGTTTPNWKLVSANSSGPQLALTGTGANEWALREAGGYLYFATSTYSATSSVSTFYLDQNGIPTFSSLGSGAVSASNGTLSAGTLSVGNGGTGLTAVGASSTVLTTNGTVAAWQKLDLAAAVYGTLPVGNGGTGQTTFSSSQLLYGAGSGAIQSVATTTQTFSGPFSLSASQGYLVGGNSATITWTGLATTSALTAGQLLYSNGGAGVTGVSTSTLTAGAGLTGSFTQIGSGGSVALDLTHANNWTGLQTFQNASSTNFSVFANAYFGGTATSTFSSNGNLVLGGTLTANNGGALGGTFSGAPVFSGTPIFGAGFVSQASSTLASTVNIAGGLVNYTTNTTSTVPNNTPYAWTLATSTTASPLFKIDSTSGSETVSLGAPGADVYIGDTNSSPNLVFQNSSTIKTASGGTLTFGSGNDILTFAVNTGFGTTTPKWPVEIASSTGPQLTLTGTGANLWSFREAGGYLYIATSSPTTFATSSATALTISPNGYLGIGSTSPSSLLSIGGVANFTSGTSTIYNNVNIQGTLKVGTSSIYLNSLATSTFAAGIQATYLDLTGASATSSFSSGINLSGGCFAVGGNCLTSVSLSGANTWTGLQTFSAGASTTNISASGEGYFGTASTTNLTVSGTPSSILSTNGTGVVGALTVGSSLSFSSNTLSLNTGNANTFTALQQFTAGASTTVLSVSDGSATTTISSATSTFAGGVTLLSGCVFYNGSCIGANAGNVGSGTQGQFAFYATNGTTVSGTSTLFVTPAGNVGIGTTNPNLTSGAGRYVSILSNGANTESALELSGNTNTGGNAVGEVSFFNQTGSTKNASISSVIGNDTSLGSLVFSTGQFGTVSEVARFDPYGNFGLSSTTPWARLSVDTTNLLAGQPEFLVGSSTRNDLIVTQDGSVGIGTTTPGSILSINGVGNFVASATSTLYNGLNITSGCVSVNGTCLTSNLGTVTSIVAGTGLTGGTITTSGTIALDLTHANTWTGLQQFAASASTTLFSAYGPAYFGATATSSFNTSGQLTLNTTNTSASSLLATNNVGLVIASSTIGWNLLKGPASAIFAFDASGNPIATTSVGVSYLTGTLPVGNGGTGQTSLSSSQLLYGAGSGAVQSVATTTQTFSGPFSLSASQGYLVGGNSATITWTGLATTSALTAGQLLYSNGGAGVTGVSTSTLTASSPLTGSFIQIGSGGSLGCQTASGSQAGCLSSADWTTFNSKLSADPFWTYANSAISTSSPVLITASTTIGNGSTTGGLTVNGTATTSGTIIVQTNGSVFGNGNSGTDLTVNGGGLRVYRAAVSDFNIVPNTGYTTVYANSGQQLSLGANNAEAIRINLGDSVNIGTTTSQYGLTILGSSTVPQLFLGDNAAADNLWAFRNAGGLFYLATSTATATSSASVFSLNANGIPTFTSLGTGAVSASNGTLSAGTLSVGNGGTGLTAVGASSTVLTTNGTVAAWQKLDLAAAVYGTLPVGNGGTGQTTFSSSQLLYGAGSGAVQSVGTSTLTASSPLTGSFIQIGSGGSLGCTTADTSHAGCLTSTDWNTFNNKINGVNLWTYANSAIATSSPVLITASTTIGNGTITGGLTVNGTATTSNLINTNVTSALALYDSSHKEGAYGGSSNPCAANQAPTTLSATGALGGCTSTFLTSAVTSVSGTWPILSSGGNTPTISWGGLATTSQPASSNILVSDGGKGIYGVSTSTLTAGAGLTGSFTQIGSGGSVALDLTHANTWTGLQQFAASASTTLFSAYGPAYFGATATSSFNTSGQLTLNTTNTSASSLLATNNVGLVIASSTIGWNLLKGPASAIFAFDASGNPIATTSVGVSYLTGVLPIAKGGTNASTQTTNGVNYFDGTSITSGVNLTFTGQNLGIGTTTPFALLSLSANNGNAYPGNNLFLISSSTSGATTTLFAVDNQGNTSIGDGSGSGDASVQFASNPNAWSVGYYSTDKSFQIASSTSLGSNVAFDISKSTLNVGIGTTTPNWKLVSANSSGPQLALTGTGANEWTLREAGGYLYFATSTYSATSSVSTFYLNQNGIPVFHSIAAASGNNCLQIDSSGIVTNTGSTCGGGASLSAANTWTGLQQFAAGASTTLFSAYGPAYFGATATSSFNTSGQLTLNTTNTSASSLLATNNVGLVIASSTIGWNLLKGPASAIFAFDASGNPIATTSVGVSYLTGVLPIAKGGTNASLSGANQVLFLNSGNTAVSSNSLYTYLSSQGSLLLGTTTAQYGLSILGTSTVPQLLLSDNAAADNSWAFRNAGGLFYLATSTATATSSASAFSLNANGIPIFHSIAAASGNNCLQTDSSGMVTNTGSACGTASGASLSVANTWTALQSFAANASTTQLSVFQKAYFGGSATTTIDSSGNIVIPSGSNLTITGKSDGCATFSSGQLNSTGSSCGGSGGFSWTTTSYGGVTVNATSTPIWLQATNPFSLIASSTYITNATTSLLTVAGGYVGYSIASTSTIPNNTPYAWTLATSTTASPLFKIDSTSGSETVSLGAPGADVYIGDTNSSPNLVFQNSSTIKTASGGTLTIGSGSDKINFGVNTGVGSSTPWGLLSVAALSSNTNPLFTISTSTASATSTAFIIDKNGLVGIGSSTPDQVLTVNGNVNVASGKCYMVNGTCIGLQSIQYFTSTGSTTWSQPANVSSVYVEVWGGGGGGGTAGANASRGGGGAGGYSAKLITGISGNVALSVGAGGNANSATQAGTTIFMATSSSIEATGGTGVAASVTGGSAGSGIGGTINLTGQTGQNGVAADSGEGGSGGSAPRGGAGGSGGGGSNGTGVALNGIAGAQPGGGGAGGTEPSGTGGAGGAGMVIVYAYEGQIGGDVAEWYETQSNVGVGDIVSVGTSTIPYTTDTGGDGLAILGKATPGNQLIGVVSTRPDKIMGDDVLTVAQHPEPIALSGRVPVKFSGENGDINIGDRIGVSSTEPGVGVKVGPFDDAIGYAISPVMHTDSGDQVLVFMHLDKGIDINSVALGLLNSSQLNSLGSTSNASGTAPLDFVGGVMSAISSRIASLTNGATTTPDEYTNSFLQNIFHELIQWFASAGNGIGDFFAGTIHTNQICVSDSSGAQTCITKSQLDELLASAAGSSGGGDQNDSSGSGSSGASSTPESGEPAIVVDGNNPATVQIGSQYNDLGAHITGPTADLNLGITASVDGATSTPVSDISVDTSSPGTHTIIYSATDQNGVTGTASRTVNVISSVPPDTSSSSSTTSDASSTPSTDTGASGSTASTTPDTSANTAVPPPDAATSPPPDTSTSSPSSADDTATSTSP